MTEVVRSKGCGNSPKNRFAEDVAVGIECGEIVPDALSETAIWTESATRRHDGREEILAAQTSGEASQRIEVDRVATHGRAGAVNGVTTTANGAARRFRHLIEFTSAKATKVAAIKNHAG